MTLTGNLNESMRGLSPHEALSKPVTDLVGVTQRVADVLQELGIATVQDLAVSSLFAIANDIAEFGRPITNPRLLHKRAMPLPTDLIVNGVRDVPLEQLNTRPLSIFAGVSAEKAKRIEDELGVRNVGEFAQWPPYRTARGILSAMTGSIDSAVTEDPEAPSDLVPGTGRYPTEKVQFEVVVLDKTLSTQQSSQKTPKGRYTSNFVQRQNIPIEMDFSPIDVSQHVDEGFVRPAIGAVLTYTQSWYTLGLSLGHLLHSVALAPGETTRIAIVDWNRQQSTSISEDTTESEALSAQMEHNRAIGEITSAVATEAQSGFSGNTTKYETHSFGSGTGAAGSYNQFAGTAGASTGIGSGQTESSSFATSNGRREINAQMTQNICDRTQQAANSVRNRRATAVKEVSQSESETISTRALTNFNHMHAMSVQYYEIVQLYRTVVELSKISRCLLLPMKVLDFSKPDVVRRFGLVLAAAALTPEIQTGVLASLGIRTNASTPPTTPAPAPSTNKGEVVINGASGMDDPEWIKVAQTAAGITFMESSADMWKLPADTRIFEWKISTGLSFENVIQKIIVEKADGMVETGFVKYKETIGSGWYVSGYDCTAKTGTVLLSSFRNFKVVTLNESKSILPDAHESSAEISFKLEYGGKQFYYRHRFDIAGNGETIDVLAITAAGIQSQESIPPSNGATDTIDSSNLSSHLQANALYYSQAVWKSMSGPAILAKLDGYTFQNKPVMDMVDPTPLATIGNYLAFRFYAEEDERWTHFLRTHPDLKVGSRKEDIVPVPSGGVFAEAVLGRFNSAEKLDITRFWNWQDSPIPITAPEIAPLQASSRAQQDTTQTGQLGQPVINLVNAPALPDPTALSAALNAVSNGALFRDMSHAAETIAAANSALTAGLAAGTQSQEIAAKYAEQAAALAAKNGTSSRSTSRQTSPGTISNAGALINHGANMDQRGVTTNPGKANGENISGNATTNDPGTSNEAAAFQSDLGGSSTNTNGTGESTGTTESSGNSMLGTLENLVLAAAPTTGGAQLAALKTIDEFRTRSGSGAWLHLDRATVARNLRDLVVAPDSLLQGSLGLCGPAVFFNTWLQIDPSAFAFFATTLFETGSGMIGGLHIQADDRLLTQDYRKVLPMMAGEKGGVCPQGHWMVMSTLRTSENNFFDYEGTPSEEWPAGTYNDEICNWLNVCGRFASVKDETDISGYGAGLSDATAAAILLDPTPQRFIIVVVAADLLDLKIPTPTISKADHVIALRSKIVPDGKGNVTFSYWSWGSTPPPLTVTTERFNKLYFGAITAETPTFSKPITGGTL